MRGSICIDIKALEENCLEAVPFDMQQFVSYLISDW